MLNQTAKAMIKISDALRDIIESNDFLKLGLSKGLFNLTSLAGFLKPKLEVMTKKSLTTSAILMGLSRTQRTFKKIAKVVQSENFKFDNISIRQNLVTATYFKSDDIHKKINTIYATNENENKFFTITESSNEITIITDEKTFKSVKKSIKTAPKNTSENISAIGIKFSEKYNSSPGLLNHIIQTLAFQNINIVEITSTFTEFLIYVKSKDAKFALDLLLNAQSR